MQNQNIENIGNDTAMFENFKKFMASQKTPEVSEVKAKKQTTKAPKVQIIQATPQPPPPPPEEPSDDEIELKPTTPKPKRQLSEKQKQNLINGRVKRDEIRKQRMDEKARQDAEYKKQVEEKLVKKAIQIKKKQIKQEKLLEPEPESDNETMIKNKPKKSAPVQPVQQPQPVPPQQKRIYYI